jgi:hypothetical protein
LGFLAFGEIRNLVENREVLLMLINRANPACLIYMVDQSASMLDPFYKSSTSKSQEVARIINQLLDETLSSCMKGKETWHYFDIAVLGYGNDKVQSAFSGSLKEQFLVPIDEIRHNYLREEEEGPIWIESQGHGSTPMRAAFAKACDLVKAWLPSHPNSVPPVVMNITDGEANDGDPSEFAFKLMEMGNNSGKVCVFNVHLTDKNYESIVFPVDDACLQDPYARALFAISSPLTGDMIEYGKNKYETLPAGARGFAYNADALVVTDFLDIGSKPADLR